MLFSVEFIMFTHKNTSKIQKKKYREKKRKKKKQMALCKRISSQKTVFDTNEDERKFTNNLFSPNGTFLFFKNILDLTWRPLNYAGDKWQTSSIQGLVRLICSRDKFSRPQKDIGLFFLTNEMNLRPFFLTMRWY